MSQERIAGMVGWLVWHCSPMSLASEGRGTEGRAVGPGL